MSSAALAEEDPYSPYHFAKTPHNAPDVTDRFPVNIKNSVKKNEISVFPNWKIIKTDV